MAVMEPIAEITGAAKSFGPNRVLDGCDLVLEPGVVHGLVGPGGSGKTLLLKVLTTLMDLDEGTLRLFGVTVDHADREGLRALRGRIGMQFQNLALFDFLNVFDNIAFPLVMSSDPPPAEELDQRVHHALKEVGLPDAAALHLSELSGGMQRRVALARAAISGAELLVFDDPTGGLDPVFSSRIFALVGELMERTGATVVVTSHDVDRMARVCGRFHVMDRGKVIYSGGLSEGIESSDERVRTFLTVEA
ncbi:MAG: ATP-binding cassette domain-containing protein [Deltaproteobacteria bacterium]|nr:ATP-binding cassette domain-containing protein [Deltaproteobacteria bacterium]